MVRQVLWSLNPALQFDDPLADAYTVARTVPPRRYLCDPPIGNIFRVLSDLVFRIRLIFCSCNDVDRARRECAQGAPASATAAVPEAWRIPET